MSEISDWKRYVLPDLLNDAKAQGRAESAARIEQLERENAKVKLVYEDMTARMDRIRSGAFYAEIADRATAAEARADALAKRLEEIRGIATAIGYVGIGSDPRIARIASLATEPEQKETDNG
jgi:hypothetical protein